MHFFARRNVTETGSADDDVHTAPSFRGSVHTLSAVDAVSEAPSVNVNVNVKVSKTASHPLQTTVCGTECELACCDSTKQNACRSTQLELDSPNESNMSQTDHCIQQQQQDIVTSLPVVPATMSGRSKSLPNLHCTAPARVLKRSSDSTLTFAKRRRRAGLAVHNIGWTASAFSDDTKSSSGTEMDICPPEAPSSAFSSSSSSSSLPLHHHHHHHHPNNPINTSINIPTPPVNHSPSPSSSIHLVDPAPHVSKESMTSGPSALGSGWKQNYTINMVSAPPVNLTSLKEIDLQEIFKNPQLRHDIVFDPQLQFRPNLDGERGKRKKMAADKYWASLVEECELLCRGGDTGAQGEGIEASAKVLVLFQTLRDIIISLLPAKTRSYVECVLDADLIHQQLKHRALDFVGLAKWLGSVFKAHCAPMRDAWVDQMIEKISHGVELGSTSEVVDGLRMVFSILEAMKLDVANHQIRTLRHILVESAVEFEQEYYHLVITRGKLDLQDAIDWYRGLEAKAKSSFADDDEMDPTSADSSFDPRDCFVDGLVKLMLCNGVCEFPSTFGFDVYRMASFRADLRRVVCLQLTMMIYQQLLKSEATSTKVSIQCNAEHLTAFKNDVLAIVSDSNGNTKWTKNVHSLALEISRRIQQLTSPNTITTLPRSDLVNVASSWLSKHLQPKSPVYSLMEKRMASQLATLVCSGIKSNSHSLEGVTVPVEGSDTNLCLAAEVQGLCERLQVLAKFHWGVFSKYYLAEPNLDDGANTVNAHAHFFKVVASRAGPGIGSMASTSGAGRVRQPSTC